MIRLIPLLIIVVAAYNALVLIGGMSVDAVLFSLSMPSGDMLGLTLGGMLLAVGLILLYLEILKATRTTGAAVADHVLSMAVFIVALLELILVPAFGTVTFLLITLMTLIDVVAGFTVTIQTARRDFGVDPGIR